MMFREEIRRLKHQAEPFRDEISFLSSAGFAAKFCPDEALKDYEKDTEGGTPSYSREYTVLYAYKEIREESEIFDIHIELILTAPECSRYWSAYIISSVPCRAGDASPYSRTAGHFQALSPESLLDELNSFLKENHIGEGA